MKAILTVIGKDKPGIIAAVSSFLAEKSINIEDISQTVMQGYFSMFMQIDLGGTAESLSALTEEAAALGGRIGVQIILQNRDIFDAMYRV